MNCSRPKYTSVFTGAMGAWLALVIVKLANAIIFPEFSGAPTRGWGMLLESWPVYWGYISLAMVLAAALPLWRWAPLSPKWILFLPLCWLGWQLFSAAQTVDPALTGPTVVHFAACATCFYLGVFVLGQLPGLTPVWLGAAIGLLIALRAGWDQHFGGLEETRRFFDNLNSQDYPPELRAQFETPEFRRKIASNRIWGTFFYPNALAGGILLLLPVALAGLWQLTKPFARFLKLVLTTVFGGVALACLYWSGSKAGWLIALAQATLVFLHLRMSTRVKILAISVGLTAGLAAFAAKYAHYFSQGAQSVSARFDYWRAGARSMVAEPWLGTGPGTFQQGYRRFKEPEAEMTRLAHCDYLQQGTDSGIVGLLAYSTWVWGSLWLLYRRRKRMDCALRMVWLGVFGFAGQSLVEFGLYIPALAWPCFLFLGTLWGKHGSHLPQQKPVDNPSIARLPCAAR